MSNSENVYIRKIDFGDADDVLVWENDVENWRSSSNDSPYTILDIINLISELQDVAVAKQGRWIICGVSDDRTIGAVDLTEINFEKGIATVGVLVAKKDDREKGFATAGIKFLESEARGLGIKKLACTIHSDNYASIRLFEKLNFEKIGKTYVECIFDVF